MFGYYSPVLLLQIFCIYHAYTNSKEYWWYFLIFFLPLIGTIIYLYVHFVNQRNLDLVTDSIQNAFTDDPKLQKLKKELEFSDTINNRINLANAYLERGDGKMAKEHYELCLQGAYRDDVAILTKLLHANFLEKDFAKAVEIGNQIKTDLSFKKSLERVSYALSLQELGQNDLALAEFKNMDARYANYPQRLAYAKYLHSIGNEEESTAKLDQLVAETKQMDRTVKRLNNEIIREINKAAQNGFS